MEDDPTVELPPRRRPQGVIHALPQTLRGRRAALAGAGSLALVAVGGAVFWWSRPEATPEPPPLAPPPPRVVDAPPLLDFAGLLAHRAVAPTAHRWAANPLVWVLDFPTLLTQGRAMNRAAALLEKATTPRDRVLDDTALARAIAADGRTEENWYFGHNYRASELEQMFTLAARDGVTLNPLEAWLRSQVQLSRRTEPSRDAAILSIPAIGPQVDENLRRVILRHELGHGQFFTLPLFAAHVMRVWARDFTEADRTDMRRFLATEGYDPSLEEVMANEAMAYLLYTDDRRIFDPARDLGWPDTRADRLRAALRTGAPAEP